MVILRELSDSREPLETPRLGSNRERQIHSHFTRADGSLNERGYISELLGFLVSSSDEEDNIESDSDSSSRSSDCVIISRSSFTGKMLVKYQPVVLEEFAGGMETLLKYNSVGSVRCFSEVVKLYNGGDDAEVIEHHVGEGELIIMVNIVDPHYFYMYGTIIQTFNVWFPLTAFEIAVLRVLNVALIQLHPYSWAFVKAFEVTCFGLGVTPSVEFLDTFCLLDIKDVIRHETNPKGLLSFLKTMRRVEKDEWLSYLAKSRQKKLLPDAPVNPLTQVVVEDGAPKGTKRKKKMEASKASSKIPKRDDGSSANMDEGDQSKVGEQQDLADGGTGPSSSPNKAKASLPTGTQAPPAWGSDFDPSTFLNSHIAMKGDSVKFDSMEVAELRKLALGHELKGAVLNNLLSQRQEKERLARLLLGRIGRIQSYIKSTLHLDSDGTLWKSESLHSERVQKLKRDQKPNLFRSSNRIRMSTRVQKLRDVQMPIRDYQRPFIQNQSDFKDIKGSSEAKEIPLVIRRATSTTLIKPDDLLKDN
ncbi:hypothetical protein TSUD_30380 [Trifolium subterraneum]|uniref:Uncharacterized protein n=1 Tax=Trifolium subterraneum TaxID=3900 RepID=A0A2Z6MW43_TRISU|nr:hypothetical protein TSUD_30380 [Trifolium subterraneum]